jgi:hypothetical protein
MSNKSKKRENKRGSNKRETKKNNKKQTRKQQKQQNKKIRGGEQVENVYAENLKNGDMIYIKNKYGHDEKVKVISANLTNPSWAPNPLVKFVEVKYQEENQTKPKSEFYTPATEVKRVKKNDEPKHIIPEVPAGFERQTKYARDLKKYDIIEDKTQKNLVDTDEGKVNGYIVDYNYTGYFGGKYYTLKNDPKQHKYDFDDKVNIIISKKTGKSPAEPAQPKPADPVVESTATQGPPVVESTATQGPPVVEPPPTPPATPEPSVDAVVAESTATQKETESITVGGRKTRKQKQRKQNK